jgi:hypothetical protein
MISLSEVIPRTFLTSSPGPKAEELGLAEDEKTEPQPVGNLIISEISLRNLISADAEGGSDPFVLFSAGPRSWSR